MRLITSLRSKVAASVVAATIAGAVIMFLGSGSAALHLMVRSYDGGAGAIDAGPNAVSQVVVEEWSNRLTDGVMMSWVGLVNVPDDGPARFAVASAGTVEIRVDGRLVLRRSESGVVTLVEASTSVPPGVHLVSIVFRHIAGPTNLVLRWRLGENDRLADIPTTAFSPTRLGAWQWSARLLIPAALFAVNLAWLVLVTTALVAIGRRLWSIPTWSTQDRYVLGLSLVLFVCGVWWGWPGTGWAVDELSPDMIRDAVKARFANGWHDKYPPVSYYLLTIAYVPTLAAEFLQRVGPADDHVEAVLQLQGRFVSVLASMGTVVAVMVLAGRLLSRAHVWPAALGAACCLPLAFYAKTANVEAAYTFIVAWSLVTFEEVVRKPSIRNVVLLGVLAGLAVATKDQAAGVYVMPGLYLCIVMRRQAWLLAAGFCSCVVALGAAFNLPANLSGAMSHLDVIFGPTSADYRQFGMTLRDQVDLAGHVAQRLFGMLGIAGSVAVGLGIAAGARDVTRRLPIWLWLSGLSYYAVFIVFAGYVYDRFLLPVLPILALLVAIGVRFVIDECRPPLSRWVAGAIVAGILIQAVWLDGIMVFDSRYGAERWFRRTVGPGNVVISFAPESYLPRLDGLRDAALPQLLEEVERTKPDYIVLNEDFARRFDDDPASTVWREWIRDSLGPYAVAFRSRREEFPLRAWLRPLLEPYADDPHTNLSKISPPIVVFKRQPG